jgi:hypothetical protein
VISKKGNVYQWRPNHFDLTVWSKNAKCYVKN